MQIHHKYTRKSLKFLKLKLETICVLNKTKTYDYFSSRAIVWETIRSQDRDRDLNPGGLDLKFLIINLRIRIHNSFSDPEHWRKVSCDCTEAGLSVAWAGDLSERLAISITAGSINSADFSPLCPAKIPGNETNVRIPRKLI